MFSSGWESLSFPCGHPEVARHGGRLGLGLGVGWAGLRSLSQHPFPALGSAESWGFPAPGEASTSCGSRGILQSLSAGPVLCCPRQALEEPGTFPESLQLDLPPVRAAVGCGSGYDTPEPV